MNDFSKTQEYIRERVTLIIELLKKININEYLFCGVTYNARIDIGEKKPIEFIRKYLGGVVPNLFEIGNSEIVSEGISLALDINNRYQYVYQNKKNSINDCSADVDMIFSLLIDNIRTWE